MWCANRLAVSRISQLRPRKLDVVLGADIQPWLFPTEKLKQKARQNTDHDEVDPNLGWNFVHHGRFRKHRARIRGIDLHRQLIPRGWQPSQRR